MQLKILAKRTKIILLHELLFLDQLELLLLLCGEGFSKAEALGRVSHDLFQTEFGEGKAHVEECLRQAGQWEGQLVRRTRSLTVTG